MTGRSLFSRLFASHLAVALVALLILGAAAASLFERAASDDLRDRLLSHARSLAVTTDRAEPETLQTLVRSMGDATGTRLTIVALDGTVLADSVSDPASMENHADRPEVRTALSGLTGIASRRSETVGRETVYVAIRRDDRVVRAATPATTIETAERRIRVAIGLTTLSVAAAAAALSVLLSRTVARPVNEIADHVARVARGEFGQATPKGPAETQALAGAVNRMARELARRVEEIGGATALRERILSSMDEGVMLVEGGDVVYANPTARRLFGVEELTVLPPTIPPPHSGEPVTTEFTIHHPAYREVRCVTAMVNDHQALVVVRDVTETSRVERMRRDFVANASHELKTPVAAIQATAETLHSALVDDPDAARRFVDALDKQARRLSELVEDLLDLARLEQGSKRSERVALHKVAERVVSATAAAAEAAGITVSHSFEQVVVNGNVEDLALLVRNLVDNAIRYTPDGGAIEIALRAHREQAVMTVHDTGMGIPAKDLGRVFERFYRVDRARARDTGGTGLGLAIVRHIAETHGGTVVATSELGAGSTFTVTLPRA